MSLIKFTKDNLKFYDFDAEQPYAAGSFNQKYKTIINDKIEILPTQTNLPKTIKDSFLNSEYKTVKTTKPFYVYRIYGQFSNKDGTKINGAAKIGAFASTEFAESLIEVKLRLALDPQWLSTRMYEAKILIPVGTILNYGIVAPVITRGGTVLPGGAEQVLMPIDWSESWIRGYRRITFSQIHSEPEFSMDIVSVINNKSTLYPHNCPICGSLDVTYFKDEEALQFTGSKGCTYRAHYKCNACSLYW